MPKRLMASSMTLPELLMARRSFVLPASQRVYGWSEEQVNRWFADVGAKVATDTAQASWFFFGTVYLAGDADGGETAIADGQQRIVSGTMLYAAARDLETDPAARAALQACLVAPDGRLRLKLRDVDADFFRVWVQDDGATLRSYQNGDDDDDAPLSDSQSNILNNRNLIVEKLRALGPEGRRQFLAFLATSSELVVITAPSLTDAVYAYASTHKRGLRQAETDKLKSEIIGDAPVNQRAELANLWDESEAALGKDALEEMLQMMVLSRNGGLAVADLQSELLAAFDLPATAESFIRDRLVPNALAYRQIAKADRDIGDYLGLRTLEFRRARRLQSHMISLKRVSHIEWRAPALVALGTLQADAALLERVLAGLERVSAAFMIAGHEPHDCGKRYAAICRAVEQRDAKAIDVALTIDAAIKRKARDQLQSANFATKGRYRMPVLLKANDLITGEVLAVNPTDVTCEHVLPQNVERTNDGWHKAVRSADGKRYIGSNFRHRLGNLCILNHADNRRAGARPFAQKRPILSGSTFDLTRQVGKETDWTAAKIEARTQTLVDLLVAHWQL